MFRAKVDIASDNDRFYVELASYGDEGLPHRYAPLELDKTSAWTTYQVDISEFSGSVFRFKFNIDAPGLFNIVDSQVFIDSVRFEYDQWATTDGGSFNGSANWLAGIVPNEVDAPPTSSARSPRPAP